MGKRSNVKWAEYEELAHKIMSELMPFAEVTLDDHLQGVFSETPRQIDVSAKWKHEDEDMLLIVQVKDLGRRADVNTVGAFRAVIEDVGAQKGVLICSKGFSDAAIKYARNKGISLYTLLDAQSRHWPSELTIPIVWNRFLPSLSITYEFRSTRSGDVSVAGNGKAFIVRRSGRDEQIDISDLFGPPWNAGQVDREPGVRHRFVVDEQLEGLFIFEDGSEEWWRLEDVDVTYVVTRESWLGQLTPDDYRGLEDHLSDREFVPAHVRFDSLPSRPDEKWTKISDPDNVALTVKGLIMTAEQTEVDLSSLETTGFSVYEMNDGRDDSAGSCAL